MTAAPAGLYVHVPFCLTRCGYCDFNAHAGLDGLKRPYVEALQLEADLAAPDWDGIRFVSVFLGGGTPTTLSSGTIGSLLDHVRSRFDLEVPGEVTCEANPDTVDQRSLEELRSAGITPASRSASSPSTRSSWRHWDGSTHRPRPGAPTPRLAGRASMT